MEVWVKTEVKVPQYNLGEIGERMCKGLAVVCADLTPPGKTGYRLDTFSRHLSRRKHRIRESGSLLKSTIMSAASSPRSFTGIACFLLIFLYSISIGAVFPKLPTVNLIVVELAILAFCEFGPLSDFGARKLCHSCSGLLMLHLDPHDALARCSH